MTARFAVLFALFLATAVYARHAMRPEEQLTRKPLSEFSNSLGRWTGREAPKMSDDVLAALGADDLLNRYYSARREPAVSLFVGYYRSQREGDTIHSPLNCLPGAGWLPVVKERAAIQVPGRAAPIVVNRFVIRKGADRQVVLYWYQSQGRVIASEYWSKFYMVYDAVRLNRTDAAMIRVVSPIHPDETDATAANDRAVQFVQAMFPSLVTYLPL